MCLVSEWCSAGEPHDSYPTRPLLFESAVLVCEISNLSISVSPYPCLVSSHCECFFLLLKHLEYI